MKILIGLLIGVMLFSSACENDVGPLVLSEPPDAVSFSRDIQPIFDVNCIGCHDQRHPQLDLRSCCSYNGLLTVGVNAPYVDPDNPEQSKLYRHLTGDLSPMPPFGALPDREIEMVLKWINEGALDN